MSCCRRSPGARRTVPSRIPIAPSPASASSCLRPAKRAPTGASICDVARAMGFSGFDFVSPHEIFREHARLTAYNNDGRRALDLGAWADITASEYINWQPAAWPMAHSRESARGPMFADGKFMHADGRARFLRADTARSRTRAHAGVSAGAQHRPGARSLAHHDAHRQVRTPVGAHRRTFRRDQYRRRAAFRGARRVAGHAAIALGIHGGARAHRRRRAVGNGVRADSLEPRLRVGCTRGRGDQPGGRSHLWRAGTQTHAGLPSNTSRPTGMA